MRIMGGQWHAYEHGLEVGDRSDALQLPSATYEPFDAALHDGEIQAREAKSKVRGTCTGEEKVEINLFYGAIEGSVCTCGRQAQSGIVQECRDSHRNHG